MILDQLMRAVMWLADCFNRRDEEIYEEFWGDIHKISQRTVVPKHMEDYSTFEQNTGKTNEALRLLQKYFCAS